MNIFRPLFFILMLMSISLHPVFASSESGTDPEPYDTDELPEWAMDLRRFEIVSFGAVPFVTIGTTLVYGAYLKSIGEIDSMPNPLNKDSDSLSEQQQKKLFFISLGVGAGIGVTDFVINFIERQIKKSRNRKIIDSSEQIIVIPYGENTREDFIDYEVEHDETVSRVKKADSPSESAIEGEIHENTGLTEEHD